MTFSYNGAIVKILVRWLFRGIGSIPMEVAVQVWFNGRILYCLYNDVSSILTTCFKMQLNLVDF